MKTHEGSFFVSAKSAVQLITGISNDGVGAKISIFIKTHYPSRDFLDITDPAANEEHVCWFKTPSGQKSYAFSVIGLEYLCSHFPGVNAFQNRAQFLALIEDFKRSLPHKRPHGSSGDDTPNPKRAKNDQMDQLTTEGDASMLPVAVVKQALIAHTAMISGEVVKAVEPFHQAVVCSQQQMYQGNQELREEVCKIEMKAETLVENTTTIAHGLMTETMENRGKLSRQEYSIAVLNHNFRQLTKERNEDNRRNGEIIHKLSTTLEDIVKTGFDETQQMHAASFIELQVEIRKTQQKHEAEIAELKASLAEIQAIQVKQESRLAEMQETQVKHGTCLADIQATLKSLVDMLSARA